MKVRVESIQTVKATALLYVDVAFLDAQGRVVHRNDFIMQVAPKEGPAGAQTDTDVPGVILANIARYVLRWKADFRSLRQDNRTRAIQRDDTDPLNLKARPGVAALVGAELDV